MEAKEKKKPNQKELYWLTEAAASWKADHLATTWQAGYSIALVANNSNVGGTLKVWCTRLFRFD